MARRKPSARWVVVDAGGPQLTLLCRRCGQRMAVPLPMEIRALATVADGYILAHARCEPTAECPAEVEGRTGA